MQKITYTAILIAIATYGSIFLHSIYKNAINSAIQKKIIMIKDSNISSIKKAIEFNDTKEDAYKRGYLTGLIAGIEVHSATVDSMNSKIYYIPEDIKQEIYEKLQQSGTVIYINETCSIFNENNTEGH